MRAVAVRTRRRRRVRPVAFVGLVSVGNLDKLVRSWRAAVNKLVRCRGHLHHEVLLLLLRLVRGPLLPVFHVGGHFVMLNVRLLFCFVMRSTLNLARYSSSGLNFNDLSIRGI